MGRRGNKRTVSAEDGYRESIGDADVNLACADLDRAAQNEAAIMISRRFSAIRTLDLLFSPDTLAKVRAVNGMIHPEYDTVSYPNVVSGGTIVVNYTSAPSTPAIQPKMIDPQLPAFHELSVTAAEIWDIHRKYGRVKHMLRWFNRNATPAAIRVFWPAVLQLCPGARAFNEYRDAIPARYTEPPGIGPMLPLIRDTAGTVAAMALARDDSPNSDIGVRLLCHERSDSWEGLTIELNDLWFNL